MAVSQRSKPITTPAEVAAFRPPEGRSKARCLVRSKHGSGLALEARADRETKSWLYRFNIGGKQFEMTLGSSPAMGLRAARNAHGEAATLVAKGIDPRKHRKAEKARNISAWTMDQAFELWIEFYANSSGRRGSVPTPRTVTKQRGRWRVHLQEALGGAYVRDITRRDLIDVLERTALSAREEARQCLTLLRYLFDYCESREQTVENPVVGIEPAKVRARPSRPRERHLTLPELRELWKVADGGRETTDGLPRSKSAMSKPVSNAIKMLILTGARRAEVAGMRWEEVANDTWTIPAGRMKGGQAHRVHLSNEAREILKQQRKLSSSEYIFESSREAGRPIHPDSITTAVARLQGRERKEQDPDAPLHHLEHFTTHDLRRSVATLWTEAFLADPILVDAMLAHMPPKLIGTYNKGKRYKIQVDIWDRWGSFVATGCQEGLNAPPSTSA
ncbi:site-specific integrase [Halomonas sp. 3H]|uniref:tyrosine-type recombinase/integrase n=1 Tax=Halomonas sp. 3H TaxID=2952527 RepID=UPI00265DD839|nr:site-specific integrase [Halomonas sp. 3H]